MCYSVKQSRRILCAVGPDGVLEAFYKLKGSITHLQNIVGGLEKK